MSGRRIVAIVALLGILSLSILKPRAAYADTVTDIGIALAGFAAYILIIVVATNIAFDNSLAGTTMEDPTMTYDRPQDGPRVGLKCQQHSDGLTLVCW